MGRIRVLPDNVANKIAAGEVVERPASVVKELLENSLDAGATRLRIEVEAGGRKRILAADNGVGMGQDDAMLAFERHATSKLRDAADLLGIHTLGFRGEALPSIASVSRLLLETRSQEEAAGTRVEIAGGKMLSVEEQALPPGTTVTVNNLFYNVPARRRFLRTEPTELAHVTSLVTHYSLAHTDKTFVLSNEKGTLLNVTPVETLRERVYQVFGGDTLAQLVELKEISRELRLAPEPVPPTQAVAEARAAREQDEPALKTFRLSGFVSAPQVQKLNRNSIYIFVNKRLIRDRILLKALSSAYHNLIPPGCFPFALLFLDIPFDEVDVNVHPSKTEVRFRHQSFVFDLVKEGIRERLIESKPASSLPLSRQQREPQPGAAPPYSETSERLDQEPSRAEGFGPRPPAAAPARLDFGAEGIDLGPAARPFAAAAGAAPNRALHRAPSGPEEAVVSDAGDAFYAPGLPETPIEDQLHSRAPLIEPDDGALGRLGELRPLGQIHDSFIVASGADGLWIIDQHVAHERILFEKVLRERADQQVQSQRLLMPIILTLKPDQEAVFAQIEEEFRENGFDVEPFGQRTVAVKAAPAVLSAGEVEALIQEILDTPDRDLRALSLEDLRRRIAASVACHAAIKVNTPLDEAKMRWLLRELARTDCPMACPHGRPVALKYGLREILKAFHRI